MRLLISAAHKSSGKTTVTLGLCAALRRRGLAVQPFKKGPDYIDPMWLALASGRPCYNLDFYLMSEEEVRGLFASRSAGADITLIEGNKGLYDGLALDGSDSNAALAGLLGAPVVLVIDTRGMTRGIAPLLLGYQDFGPSLRFAGVVLNRTGGDRHEAKLRAAVEEYTDMRVLGAVREHADMAIVERHLGLMPSNETDEAARIISRIADRIAGETDLDALIDAAHSSAAEPIAASAPPAPPARRELRIGILRDAAFGFYYPDDLEALEHCGAQLVAIDALRDSRLPPVDGLFIGGGFPEARMNGLEANAAFRNAVREAVDSGLPVYAECGGLMYLSRAIRWRGERREMVGAIAGETVMHARPRGRGYVRLRETGASPWPLRGPDGELAEFPAHEFHYSGLDDLEVEYPYAFDILRGHGVDGRHDGIVHRNTLACYVHQRDVGGNAWTRRFTDFVRRVKNERRHAAGITG
jgi:cobyrinic acid a,c-diamide synthase